PKMTPVPVPSRARVVVIGGGVVGTSVAYHLAKLGWSDLVLLEQGRLSSGTTWHAAGLVGQLRSTQSGTRLVQYSAALYEALAAGARGIGARIFEKARVTAVSTRDGAVTGVTVDVDGGSREIEAEVVVNCAGQWAKAVGAMCGVTVPLHSAEHFYVVTEAIAG